ncbi:lipopolysaccharide-induced tumor necrosis factor-alpha factor homolog isoform X2 [Neoarius graeffei]|uniref:lipopolysaccharide-induced tumor necrosis factor-alpha factor homolog isoform X2 n=1 Tax=Neoarius graeffei TaxID=443677 RepID=UPI00298D15AF|nr:lipopolysaccharide-induced tumor necrosis factor-alpha factor homolog isoform X2 [Neoarius graeffei]
MEPNPPPSYPMHECPYPPVPVTDKKDAAYPPPPTYSATMAQPAPMVMQSQPAAVQPRIAIQTQPAVMVVMQSTLADVPAPAKCNFCQQQIVTVTKPKNGLLVWAIFGVLLVIGSVALKSESIRTSGLWWKTADYVPRQIALHVC